MNLIETQYLEIFKQIDWSEVGKGTDCMLYRYLIMEFFRRATRFAEQKNLTVNYPWAVPRAFLPEELWASDECAFEIERLLEPCPSTIQTYIGMSLYNYILFEIGKQAELISADELNIYTPLLKLCKLHGHFYMHHGAMFLWDGSEVPYIRGSWKKYREVPFLEIDDELNIINYDPK